MYKFKMKNFDSLKKIEENISIGFFEPIKMFFYLKLQFLLCCSNQSTSNNYKFISNQYDHHFEFHNIMLLENKIDLISE